MSGIVRIRPWEIAINHVRDGCESMSKRIEELEDALNEAYEVIEFYAQKTKPDIESLFAKSAMEWGENVVTWEPLTDMGLKAREWLEKWKDKI